MRRFAMKLLIALLLVHPIIGDSADENMRNAKKAEEARDFELMRKDPQLLKEHVKWMNGRRVILAKESNISNMHELTWDEELAKSAENYGMNCPKVHQNGANYRQTNDAGKFTVPPSPFYDSKEKSIEGSYLHFYELYLPTQTKFGCAYNKCNNRICNYGPHAEWKNSDIKKGPVGSGCPGEKTEDGLLCKAPVPMTTTDAPKPTTTEAPAPTTEASTLMSNSSAAATPTILAGISLISLLF